MKLVKWGSIRSSLYILTVFAILPVLAIILYTGIEQRRHFIDDAKQNVLLMTHAMAQSQQEFTESISQLLAILALMPEIRQKSIQSCNTIFNSVLAQNSDYINIAMVDLKGDVLATANTLLVKNFSDRKHVQLALETKAFSIGEYIISRIGSREPAFAYAYPVFDNKNELTAILTAAVKLGYLAKFHELSNLPEKSFVAVTDYKGIRLFYYPPQDDTNPIGEPIKTEVWQKASTAGMPGILIGSGSDNVRRIIAFDPVFFKPNTAPYLYVWTGTPESYVLAPAKAVMMRNLILLFLAALLSLFISWLISSRSLLAPIQSLVDLTKKYAQGDLKARSTAPIRLKEFATLTGMFHVMADALDANQKMVRENEARVRLLLDSLDAIVYVADMDSYEILFINEFGKKEFGDITGQKCWQSIQKDQTGPCAFCTNKYLLDGSKKPGKTYTWDFQNTLTGKWYHIIDRTIAWSNGKTVRLEIATDISDRKKEELIKTALIEKLEKALAEIKTLQGILPICSICKKIRNDKGGYEQIETYIHMHSDVNFSHTICPECMKKHYPDVEPEISD